MAKWTQITEENEDKVIIETDAKIINVHTKYGKVNIYMGENLKDITSYVSDVDFTTWYTSNPKKVSKFKKADGKRMVILKGD